MSTNDSVGAWTHSSYMIIVYVRHHVALFMDINRVYANDPTCALTDSIYTYMYMYAYTYRESVWTDSIYTYIIRWLYLWLHLFMAANDSVCAWTHSTYVYICIYAHIYT